MARARDVLVSYPLQTPDQGTLRTLVAEGLRTLVLWDARYRSRRELGALDPARRADLGLSMEAVAAECAKPFWRD